MQKQILKPHICVSVTLWSLNWTRSRENPCSLTTPFRKHQWRREREWWDREEEDGALTSPTIPLLATFPILPVSLALLSIRHKLSITLSSLSISSHFKKIIIISLKLKLKIVQDDSTLSRQKKDAESNWKAQVFTFFFVEEIRNLFNLIIGFYDYCFFMGKC